MEEVEMQAQVLFEGSIATTDEPTTPHDDSHLHLQMTKRKEKLSFSLAPYTAFAHYLHHEVESALERIYSAFLKAKVNGLLKYLQRNYHMSENEYLQLSASNQFIGTNYKFTQIFGNLLANTKVYACFYSVFNHFCQCNVYIPIEMVHELAVY
jgi:hypothetical protein